MLFHYFWLFIYYLFLLLALQPSCYGSVRVAMGGLENLYHFSCRESWRCMTWLMKIFSRVCVWRIHFSGYHQATCVSVLQIFVYVKFCVLSVHGKGQYLQLWYLGGLDQDCKWLFEMLFWVSTSSMCPASSLHDFWFEKNACTVFLKLQACTYLIIWIKEFHLHVGLKFLA